MENKINKMKNIFKYDTSSHQRIDEVHLTLRIQVWENDFHVATVFFQCWTQPKILYTLGSLTQHSA
jgi:hypothetical protein